ncbi:MAG: hypothetical protein ACRC7G_16420, partial [Beijerinckiaceae bacterium]
CRREPVKDRPELLKRDDAFTFAIAEGDLLAHVPGEDNRQHENRYQRKETGYPELTLESHAAEDFLHLSVIHPCDPFWIALHFTGN